MGAIPTQYLVVGGKGGTAPAATAKPTASAAKGNYKSVVIDLNDYFTDTKTPSLTYEAVSSPKGIVSLSTSATAAGGGNDLVADGKLTVTAAGVGTVATAKFATAMVTVSAFDGTNEAETATFSVVVVKSNEPPTFSGLVKFADLVDTATVKNKLYKADGTITREFKASIVPGPSGRATDPEPLKLRAIVGGGTAATAVVLVTDPVSTGVTNTYSVDITALKPLNPPKPVAVSIFAMDIFGVETKVTSFMVVVNTPPAVLYDLPDVVLYREDDSRSDADALDARAETITSRNAQVFYQLDHYFLDLELDSVATDTDNNVVTAGDTTCKFSTSPRQPTGRPASLALATGPVITIDAVKATTLASVTNGEEEGLRTILRDDLSRDADEMAARVEVNAVAVQAVVAAVPNVSEEVAAVPAAGVGIFTLTITCEDLDARVWSDAQIRVLDITT